MSKHVEKLLGVLGEDALSKSELMEKLGLKHRPSFRNNYFLPALRLGLVEMTVPDKPNSSKQRFRRVERRKSIHIVLMLG